MAFQILWEPAAESHLEQLGTDKAESKRYRAVSKAIRFLAQNPRHHSLQTHKWQAERCAHGGDLFEAYAENRTPAAYRIWFCYCPTDQKDTITINAIGPHP